MVMKNIKCTLVYSPKFHIQSSSYHGKDGGIDDGESSRLFCAILLCLLKVHNYHQLPILYDGNVYILFLIFFTCNIKNTFQISFAPPQNVPILS